MTSTRIEIAKEQGFVEELKNIGYSKKEIKQFQETITCPRCGRNFINLPLDGRWLAHLANCKGKQSKQKHK